LHDKVVYYLKNESARKAIAQAGQRRCLASGYDNHSRLRKMVDAVAVFSCG
jgi:spore maturation protein CgeB